MKRLVLIRHAQSKHHIEGLTGGWTDTPLSEPGQVQARLAASYCQQLLASEPEVWLFSSDLLRATQTATHVAKALEATCHLEPALRELNNGAAAGLTRDAAKLIELPLTEPTIDWLPYPGAESWRMMMARIYAAMDRLDRICPSTAVLVTHANAGVAVIQWWLRLCEHCRPAISFELDPASISELAINPWQERTIVRLNDTRHLQSPTQG